MFPVTLQSRNSGKKGKCKSQGMFKNLGQMHPEPFQK